MRRCTLLSAALVAVIATMTASAFAQQPAVLETKANGSEV